MKDEWKDLKLQDQKNEVFRWSLHWDYKTYSQVKSTKSIFSNPPNTMAEGAISSGMKIEVSYSKYSLLTKLRSSEVAKMWSSKDEVSKKSHNLKNLKKHHTWRSSWEGLLREDLKMEFIVGSLFEDAIEESSEVGGSNWS